MADNIITSLLARLKSNPKQMVIAVFAALIIVLLVYFNFLLNPQIVYLFSSRSKLSQLNADLKSARNDIAKIGDMRKQVEMYNKKIGQYEKTLPTKEGIPSLLENLSEMAKSANMRIVGIVPVDHNEPAASGRAYKEMPIKIIAKAGYHELGRFLSSLENSDRFMKVIDMLVRADKASPKKHDVELMLVTYVLLEGR